MWRYPQLIKKITHNGNGIQSMSYFYTYVGCTRFREDTIQEL
jgi:hypothetical protein